MKVFLANYAHWLLLFIVGISFFISLTSMVDSVEGTIAGVFGIVGFGGVAYLAISVEKKKKK